MNTRKTVGCRWALAFAVALVVAPFGPGYAVAESMMIPIDPGAVGDRFQERTYEFDELNGTALMGQSLSLDFIFEDMKHLGFAINDGSVFTTYGTEVTFFHNGSVSLPELENPTGFLSDENGNSVANPNGFGTGSGSGPMFTSVSYTIEFNQAIIRGIVHHDIHLDINLPEAPEFVIDRAELNLMIFDFNGQGVPPEIVVGEWAPVPEPSSFVLLGMGSLGMVAYVWRKRRRAA